MRSTIYLLAEMSREAGCSRQELEAAFLTDWPAERDFIRMILDELYATEESKRHQSDRWQRETGF
jgi:hypothetical protein